MAKKQIFYINARNCGTKKAMWKEQEGTLYTIELVDNGEFDIETMKFVD